MVGNSDENKTEYLFHKNLCYFNLDSKAFLSHLILEYSTCSIFWSRQGKKTGSM